MHRRCTNAKRKVSFCSFQFFSFFISYLCFCYVFVSLSLGRGFTFLPRGFESAPRCKFAPLPGFSPLSVKALRRSEEYILMFSFVFFSFTLLFPDSFTSFSFHTLLLQAFLFLIAKKFFIFIFLLFFFVSRL